MNDLIESYGKLGVRLVFNADGGLWLKNWIEDSFPQAISILNYYHVCEHLHSFAIVAFSDKAKRKKWTDKQQELLLQSKLTTAVKNIKRQDKESKEALLLINYYTNNAGRMDYKHYGNVGAGLIGSGAIDPIAINPIAVGSAH